MPKVKKIDEVTVLAGQMLDHLGSRRDLGPGAYPPSLAQLAELCGVPLDDARLLKAAAKKPFTDKATAKATAKITLESPVYFKEDVPSKAELAEREVGALASRMLRVLESQRELGGDAYPPTLGRLAELCGLRSSNPIVAKAATHPTMAAEVTFANAGKPASESPALLHGDLDRGDLAWLTFAFDRSHKPKVTLAFTPKQLASKLQKSLQGPFVEALMARIDRNELPAGYAWLANKEPLLFRVADVQPGVPAAREVAAAPEASPPASIVDFAATFREAFDRLDRRNGLSNNVKLVDLRRELAGFARGEFDAGLRQLRVEREFSLDSHEGLLKPLTPGEREAGIAESGSLLVYASRR